MYLSLHIERLYLGCYLVDINQNTCNNTHVPQRTSVRPLLNIPDLPLEITDEA